MKKNQYRFHVVSCINWDFFWTSKHEVSLSLSKLGQVYFYNPIFALQSFVLAIQPVVKNPRFKNIKIVDSTVVKRMNFYYMVKQELSNFKVVFRLNRNDVMIYYHPIGQTLSFLWAFISRKKIVFYFADDYIRMSRGILTVKIFLKLVVPLWCRLASVIICPSREIIKKYKKYSGNFVFLPHGVNFELNKYKFERKKRTHFVVGYSGGIDEGILVDDLLFLAAKIRDLEVWIIACGQKCNEYEIKAKKLHLKNVKFLGCKSKSELPMLFNQFTLAIMPFKNGTWKDVCAPVKMFEYWSCKLPVISTMTPELENFSDYLLFYKNQNDLINKVRELIKKPEIIEKLGEKGYRKTLLDHDWSGGLRENFLRVVKEIL